MAAYRWKPGSHTKIEAQQAGEELERIRTWHNGRLEPAMVIEASRDPGAPLHPAFEWDNEAAAERYRIEQAKYLIRSVEVVITPDATRPPVRAFVSVSRDKDRSYTSTVHALADPDLRQQVLGQALKELEAWQQRYAELVELSQVFAAIGQARLAR
jgi:hypothetical protein